MPPALGITLKRCVNQLERAIHGRALHTRQRFAMPQLLGNEPLNLVERGEARHEHEGVCPLGAGRSVPSESP